MAKKTNYSYVGIAFIILVFGIIFIPRIIDRLSNSDVTRDESRSKIVTTQKIETINKNQSDLEYIPDGQGGNRKVPAFSFTNQNNKTITNKDYLGKVYLVEFFFTTCPTICPRMSDNLVQIQNHFEDYTDNFGVASFTIMPEVDTPEVLKAYAKKYGITNPNWHLMTGDEETIYKLANEGFYLYAAKGEDATGFEHSGNFALIDKEGYIRSRLTSKDNPLIYYNGIVSEEEGVDDEGIPQEISILKEDIAKLLKE
ncbi:MAG: SCO family protein [Winogradskyella sp.]|uniref:SCO family protein n=1 Tax=Winogradskyella sp. TaxID=1883156 RepID=UPI00184C7B37|nr:SCO family protein [Winogradskyella sp.]MBT8244994.1 SCO family protein [Winogradskyella sp.]NNK22164.1 SCO family protein [Winogradskyella sp.]